MSSATLEVWEQIQKLSKREQEELRYRLIREAWPESSESPDFFIAPVPMAPPGYFENIDTREEIAEENEFARHSGIEVPADLE